MGLTTNLFSGRGETDHDLAVIEGHWPDDCDGAVIVVGPDKRAPGGHWFGAHGLLCRIDLAPLADGRIRVRHRRVRTPLARVREWFPFLFATVAFMELSPLGVSNLANTNVQPIDGRLFVGYDAGRPVEVDPETLDVLSAVGSNGEWFQAAPGLYEPLVSVAAHPAPDHDEPALYFVNYSPVPSTDGAPEVYLARWDLAGEIQRWRLDGVGDIDSFHDIKATRDYLVFTDLPFVVDPATFRGAPRTQVNQDFTRLYIVAKADLAATPVGGTVSVREVIIPMPTGHLTVDLENPDGVVTAYLEHIPLADLMLTATAESVTRDGTPIHPDHEGLIALAVQPGAVGRYRIDTASGEILDDDLATDDRFWGGILATRNLWTEEGRRAGRALWYAGLGFDPGVIPSTWWDLYGDGALEHLVAPEDLPTEPVAASLSRFDLESMKVTDVFSFPSGAFASPPTFVPRRGGSGPDDGYVVAIVHRDGPKEIQIFHGSALERGPLARVSAPDFRPPLLLHSCWMSSDGPAWTSDYRVSAWADVWGAIRALPGHVVRIARLARAMRHELG
ncbi:MAG: carotenoid oxygenase family protein [Acidimicrobiales bacterium]